MKELKKLESEPRLSPWLIESNAKKNLSKDGFGEVAVYPSGCHFYEVTQRCLTKEKEASKNIFTEPLSLGMGQFI